MRAGGKIGENFLLVKISAYTVTSKVEKIYIMSVRLLVCVWQGTLYLHKQDELKEVSKQVYIQ